MGVIDFFTSSDLRLLRQEEIGGPKEPNHARADRQQFDSSDCVRAQRILARRKFSSGYKLFSLCLLFGVSILRQSTFNSSLQVKQSPDHRMANGNTLFVRSRQLRVVRKGPLADLLGHPK